MGQPRVAEATTKTSDIKPWKMFKILTMIFLLFKNKNPLARLIGNSPSLTC
jgi:hypothetical protein